MSHTRDASPQWARRRVGNSVDHVDGDEDNYNRVERGRCEWASRGNSLSRLASRRAEAWHNARMATTRHVQSSAGRVCRLDAIPRVGLNNSATFEAATTSGDG